MTNRRPVIGLLVLTLMLAGFVGGLLVHRWQNDGGPAEAGGPIVLDSTQAQGEFRLSALGPDQIAVIFFGYTFCPDVCPVTLANMRQALAQLPEKARERVVPVLISVDPERDTLARLEAYVSHFGPAFVGATGTPEALAEIGERYGVVWRKVGAEEDPQGYSVDHSSSIFIVDAQGHILEQVVFSPTPDVLREALSRALAF
ncbi:SCO family protein [Halomonas shantousis]